MTKTPLCLLCALVVLLGSPGPLRAQQPAASAPAPAAGPDAPAPTAGPDEIPRIRVKAFRVTGNTLLSPSALDAALFFFKGTRTLKELEAAADALEALYAKAGYGGVIAYVPPQQIETGVVEIVVVEGRISQVFVLDNRRDPENLVLRALPQLRAGATPEPRLIDQQVEFSNQNPARQVAVTLEPGVEQGDIEARITVTESAVQTWNLGLDNTGNEQTGRLRTRLGYTRANLFGLDHTIQLGLQLAPEEPSSVANLSGAWRIPLYGIGVMLDLVAGYSDIDGGSTNTAVGALEFRGEGHTLGAHLTKALPRFGAFAQRFSLGLDYRAYLNECSIAGFPDGACGSAGASVAVSPASLDYQLQFDGRVPAAVQLSYFANTGAFGSDAGQDAFDLARPGAERAFHGGRLQAQSMVRLPRDFQLQARLAGQATSFALVPGEQFGLAGTNAVRGYEEREVAGDQAVLLSLELRSADLAKFSAGWLDHAQAVGFVDAGRTWNHLDTFCRDTESVCTLASAGPGLRLAKGAGQLRLDLASALEPGNLTSRGDLFLHMQASYDFR